MRKPHLRKVRGTWRCYAGRYVYVGSTALSAYAAHARQELIREAGDILVRQPLRRFMGEWDPVFARKSDSK